MATPRNTTNSVECWGTYETVLHGPEIGNPFVDIKISAEFRFKHRAVEVDGFYDGSGIYRVRFMPDTVGGWTYLTKSNVPELDGKSGRFICITPTQRNHGPVQVRNTFHFDYADGTHYFPIGTTCYAWAHQGDELEEQTLKTLRSSPFNKVRMCVFPKDYPYNKVNPQYYPFERDATGSNDYTRFCPAFFQHFEMRVGDLMELGIEADLILFHPYDRWGYDGMSSEVNDRYLRYVVARLSAYRNVWWSMANEFDFCRSKSMEDWDHLFRVVQESDPYQHLRSIHNGVLIYDHSKPWVTHASIQSSDFSRIQEWRQTYRKPIIYDEVQYEGNIPEDFGDISAQELVRRFWEGTAAGAYVGHGETYLHPLDILWWSKGVVLHGQSPSRIAFLRKILENGPPEGLNPILSQICSWRNTTNRVAGKEGEYYLYYLGLHQPAEVKFTLAPNVLYTVEVIDTWEKTITPVEGKFQGAFTIKLPCKPYLAICIRKLDQGKPV